MIMIKNRKLLVVVMVFLSIIILISGCERKQYTLDEAQELTSMYYIRIINDFYQIEKGNVSVEDFFLNARFYHEKIKNIIRNTELDEQSKKILLNSFDLYINRMLETNFLKTD